MLLERNIVHFHKNKLARATANLSISEESWWQSLTSKLLLADESDVETISSINFLDPVPAIKSYLSKKLFKSVSTSTIDNLTEDEKDTISGLNWYQEFMFNYLNVTELDVLSVAVVIVLARYSTAKDSKLGDY